MREHLGVFASLLAVAAIVTGLALGVLGLGDRAAAHGVRDTLAQQTGEEGALQFSMQGADDPDRDAAVREVIAREFRSGDRAVPLTVHHTIRSAIPLPLDDTGVEVPYAIVVSIPDVAEHAELVEGAWPAGAGEATLQADAAAALGLTVGDDIVLDARPLTISGTWRVSDPLAPRWLGDPLLISGMEARGSGRGPLVVDPSLWEGLVDVRRDAWTLVPRAADFEPRDLGPTLRAWAAIDDAVAEAGVGSVGDHDGRFAITASELDRGVRALDAVAPAALLLVAMIAFVTFVELGRLLAQVRTRELALLWARGATARGVGRTTAAETAIAVVGGAALGLGGAMLAVVSGDAQGVERLGALWVLVPALVIAVSVVAVSVQAMITTRRAARIDDPSRTGRAARLTSGGAVVLVVIAGALATWQLRLYGSPLTPGADGSSAVDPVAVSAPPLAVAAVLLAGLMLLPRLTPLVETIAARDRRAPRVLAARSVARRLGLFATPAALVALAVSQVLIAVGYADTWERSHAQAHALRAGAELRVETAPVSLDGSMLDALVEVPGVTHVAPVTRDVVPFGEESVQLVAIAPDALVELGLDGRGTVDPESLGELIRGAETGAAVPAGAREVTLRFTTSTGDPVEDVALWLQSSDGLLRRSVAAPTPDGHSAPLPPLPTGDAWHLVAIDLALQYSESADRMTVLLDSASADGRAMDLAKGWRGTDLYDGSPLDPAGQNGAAGRPGTELRLTPVPGEGVVPIVVTRALAASLGAAGGPPFGLPFPQGVLAVQIVGVVDGIPASDRSAAALIDARLYDAALLRWLEEDAGPRTAWIGVDDSDPLAPDAVAALRAVLAGQGRVVPASDDPAGRMLSASTTMFALTAAGSAILALGALGAVVGAHLRARRGETAVLRALGFSAREQGRLRGREILGVAAYGLLVGLVAGAVVVIVIITVFARAAVPGAYSSIPTDVAIDPLVLGAALAGWCVALGALVVGYAASVTRQARRARIPEDAR